MKIEVGKTGSSTFPPGACQRFSHSFHRPSEGTTTSYEVIPQTNERRESLRVYYEVVIHGALLGVVKHFKNLTKHFKFDQIFQNLT